MPAYGYERAVIDPEHGLLRFREVSFDLNPADLRRVAASLQHDAERAEAGDWRSDRAPIDEYDRPWRENHPELAINVLRRSSADSDRRDAVVRPAAVAPPRAFRSHEMAESTDFAEINEMVGRAAVPGHITFDPAR